MALKDLKSDLSKFRRPVEDPLVDKKRVDVPKTSNQTPLSKFLENTPDAPKSKSTTPKQGVTPSKFDNSSNFLGETTPNNFDNSSNNLGETTPTRMSLSERFLGETTPSKFDNSSNNIGETTPVDFDNTSNFLGETTPTEFRFTQQFLGETTPSEFKFVQQFLGETSPVGFDNASNFLGETTPAGFDNSSNFLGETTPNEFDGDSNFLGETTPVDFDNASNFLGVTNTTNFTFDPNFDSQAVTPTYVNFIVDDKAVGFSPFQKAKSNSKFVGVDPSQTVFDSLTSDILIVGYGNKTFKFDDTRYNVTKENDSGLGSSYTDAVLKDTYNKFNLKEESHNTWPIKQPFILSGIQRKSGEPQTLGFGSFSFIRGGAITSTARAAIDVARMGQFLLTPRGITWSLKQVGMQRTQRYGKTWTPVNLLANIGTQHLGLRFDRPGVLPQGDETYKYENIKNKNSANDGGEEEIGFLVDVYKTFSTKTTEDSFVLRKDKKGGFGSLYGIGDTEYKRQHSTFFTKGQTTSDETANFVQKINPFAKDFDPEESRYEKNLEEFGNNVDSVLSEEGIDKTFEDRGLTKSDGLIKEQPDIADYEFASYGKIKKRSNDLEGRRTTTTNDFRNLTDKNKEISELSDYKEFNQEARTFEPLRGKVNAKRVDWTNLDKNSPDNIDRWDKIMGSDKGDKTTLKNDLVHLFFYTYKGKGQDGDDYIQFRGTATGITETFSPSYNAEKPNGRADKVYMYTEFERSLTFNFKAYAGSRIEMQPMWKKLQYLATLTMPDYGTGLGYRGNVIGFRLGSLYGNGEHGVPALITSLTYNITDDASWDISILGERNPIGEIPKMIDITVGLTLLPEYFYKKDTTIYSRDWFKTQTAINTETTTPPEAS